MKLNLPNPITALVILAAIAGFAHFVSANESSNSVGKPWVQFITWNQPQNNPSVYSFNEESVREKHGLTIVDVKGEWEKPTFVGHFSNVKSNVTTYALDCVNGRYIVGDAEYTGMNGKAVIQKADPYARWYPIEPANIMFDLAKRVC